MSVLKDTVLMANKFRGCLVGALIGDCLGAPFEGDDQVSKVVLNNYFDKLEGSFSRNNLKTYTDDTAMTKSVAESLIAKRGMDSNDMAQRFVEEFFKEPRRGYGENVVSVFQKLRSQKFENVFKPAEEQFSGSGSCGNGGAMRIAPVAIFGLNNYNNMLGIAETITRITHTHTFGINGALFQCIALHQCLSLDPKEPLDVKEFSLQLKEKVSDIEQNINDTSRTKTYVSKIEGMEKLLESENKGMAIPDEEVDVVLGTNTLALQSVPTAAYCFLRAQKEIPEIKTDNPFRRTIQYAISLGGDTDTIASMAGAIAGSYYGYENINKNLQVHCEAVDKIIDLADQIYDLVFG